MPTPKHRLAAFTLVELLVVISIIGVLIAMLIPAVQQAREASRRSQCSNNLKQIGLAYLCYESANQNFPPAYISKWATPPPDPQMPPPSVGWGIFILPHLEQKILYDRYNFKVPFYDTKPSAYIDNQRISNTVIESFRCPSAPINNPYTYTFIYPPYPEITWQASPADYSPIARVASELASYLELGYTTEQINKGILKGALQPDSPTPANSISDGTSHTILVAEMAGKNDLWQKGINTNQKLSGQYGGEGGWADPTSSASVFIGSSEDGTVAPGSSGVNCSNDYGLYSFHRVLANTLFADGSVQSIAAEIDIRILVALITRSGGELEANP